MVITPTPITDAGLAELERSIADGEAQAHRGMPINYTTLRALVHRLRTSEADLAASRGLSVAAIEQISIASARAEKAEAEVARLAAIRRIQLAHAFVAGVNWQADPRNCAGVKIVAGVAFADKLIANGDPMPESAMPELTSDEVLRGALSDCRHDEASIEDTADWIVEALDLAGWYISAIPPAASRPDPAQPGQSSAQPAAERAIQPQEISMDINTLARAARLVVQMHEAHCDNIGETLEDEDAVLFAEAKEIILAFDRATQPAAGSAAGKGE